MGGYICNKKLLLSKLSENGGIDPFLPTNQEDQRKQLNEYELISINNNNNKPSVITVATAPRLSTHASFTSLLTSINNEYDALVLELFDTRKVLQETRKELSQALYQNDAAVRVIARVTMERDDAKQKLSSFDITSSVQKQQPSNVVIEEELVEEPNT